MAAVAERAATELAATASATLVAIEEDSNSDDPSIPSAAYARMQPRWTKCRDVFGGTETIRAGGTKYLIPYKGESAARYLERAQLAAFYNAYKRTVLASVGMILEEEPTFGDDMPQALIDLWENITGDGTHGVVFTRRLLTSGIVDSYAGIFVDHKRPDSPNVDRSSASAAASAEGSVELSADDEERLGLRPYFVLYRADDVIKAVYETVNGIKTLVLLILREVASERRGKFGQRTVTRYRVYANTNGVIRYELWKSPDIGGGRPVQEGTTRVITNQTRIPWSPFVAGDEVPGSTGEYTPPMIDLADLNIQYHNSLSNHLSLQRLAYVPTPVRIGAQPDNDGVYPELILGPSNTIEAPVTEGVAEPVYWLSPPVDVLDAGERTLTQTKADMATLGAAFLSSETRAAETAEGKRIDSAASRATIGTVSKAAKDCLELAFQFAGNYRKMQSGSITMNEDFTGEKVDSTFLAVLLDAFTRDVITLQELRYVIQTGQLPEDFDAESKEIITELLAAAAAREEAKRLEAEARAANGGGDPALDAVL